MSLIPLLVGLLLACAGPALARDMTAPRVTHTQVDWDAVAVALAGTTAAANTPRDTLARLNDKMGERFPGIVGSPVPVLLPFDTAAWLADRAAGRMPADPARRYSSGYGAPKSFLPGPSGYDAAFAITPSDLLSDMSFAKPVEVQISGSELVYELDTPTLANGVAVPALEAEFPGIRRLILERELRYTFVRYGVPYIVAIGCNDGPAHGRRMACRQAEKIAEHFLKALRIAGGTPHAAAMTDAAAAPAPAVVRPAIERPAPVSKTFTYFGPGQLIPGTGMGGNSGVRDYTVYANVRFPIARAPAYANSQSFMHWGDCDHTGRVFAGRRGKGAPYRCRVNGRPLVFDETRNYAYPWRDNFCEHRHFFVGQCPSGLGHQGQDIRPGACELRNDGADRCKPYLHDVVAARSGTILRAPNQPALMLIVNAPGEHVRFRYLHMNPKMLDADGVLSGRFVREGELIGKVGNYYRFEGGTSYHLHFDMQVPTRDGWVFVNPYMTLVAAYERLIGARGTEMDETPVASVNTSARAGAGDDTATAASPAPPPQRELPQLTLAGEQGLIPHPLNRDSGSSTPVKAPDDEGQRSKSSAASPCAAKAAARAGDGRHCEHRHKHGARAKRTRVVRTVGRDFPVAGLGAWSIERDIYARHGRHNSRYDRF